MGPLLVDSAGTLVVFTDSRHAQRSPGATVSSDVVGRLDRSDEGAGEKRDRKNSPGEYGEIRVVRTS